MVDVDVDTGDGDEMEAKEVETDSLTSRAPSHAASPPPVSVRHVRLAIHSDNDSAGTAGVAGSETETKNARTLAMPPPLDLSGICFDPGGLWLYVASTAGIVEWACAGRGRLGVKFPPFFFSFSVFDSLPRSLKLGPHVHVLIRNLNKVHKSFMVSLFSFPSPHFSFCSGWYHKHLPS
jgi:hypothetical protein